MAAVEGELGLDDVADLEVCGGERDCFRSAVGEDELVNVDADCVGECSGSGGRVGVVCTAVGRRPRRSLSRKATSGANGFMLAERSIIDEGSKPSAAATRPPSPPWLRAGGTTLWVLEAGVVTGEGGCAGRVRRRCR